MASISFQFISSGDSASYRIVRYGHPDHGKRVEIQHKIYPLWTRRDKTHIRKHYNYSPTDYVREVAKVKDYLHFEYNAERPLDLEYAAAFVAESHENWERARAKYPDIGPFESHVKGTAHAVKGTDGKYRWVFVNL